MDMCPTLQAFLADQGCEYDVFICHQGDDKHFVERQLYPLIQECGLRAFFDKESLEKGNRAQATIARAIISAPFFLVVLSESFVNEPYPEAELKAALAFPDEYQKTIIPVFYKMTTAKCHRLTRKMYRKLSDTTGWERENRTDKQLAQCISQHMKQNAEKQLCSSVIKQYGFDVFYE